MGWGYIELAVRASRVRVRIGVRVRVRLRLMVRLRAWWRTSLLGGARGGVGVRQRHEHLLRRQALLRHAAHHPRHEEPVLGCAGHGHAYALVAHDLG